MNANQLLDAIRNAAKSMGVQRLTLTAFCAHTGISSNHILRHFDSWSEACGTAGVDCGPTGRENLRPNPRISEDACICEMRKIADLLGTKVLSKQAFQKHASFSSYTVLKRFGSWARALEAAGLQRNENHHDEIPLPVLAADFLKAAAQLRRIPTVRSVVRRSAHGLNSFTRKWQGYDNFKKLAIKHLLSGGEIPDGELKSLLEAEARRFDPKSLDTAQGTAPFHSGRTLGFRAFAFVPTYEQEVVAIFAAVAEELGFEILSQRVAFPDCLARRRLTGPRNRFADCRIEFELFSRDFVTHGHAVTGCELIVCWEHNWPESPIEVLEMQSPIRKLPGWR
jgi:hypothetical protein